MTPVDCAPALICSVAEEDPRALAGEWQQLLQEAGLHSPFLRPAWLQAWQRELAPDADLLLLSVREGERLIGVMGLVRRGDDLCFAGDSTICDYADIVSCESSRGVVVEALLAGLAERPWRRLILWGVRADSPTLSALPAAAERAGLRLGIEREAVCPRVRLPATWDEYLLTLSKKDRHELRRKIRRLQGAGAVQECVLSRPAEIAEALPDFFHLHRTSRQDKATFMTDEMERFFRSICATLSAQDLVRLYFLELDRRRVAGVLGFDCGDEIWLYNSGFDPAFASLSVGLVSKALALRQAIEQGKRCYDFLRGAEPYKYDLGAHDFDVLRCTLTRAESAWPAMEPADVR